MFTTDSRVENFLTQMGVKWEYVNGILFTTLTLTVIGGE